MDGLLYQSVDLADVIREAIEIDRHRLVVLGSPTFFWRPGQGRLRDSGFAAHPRFSPNGVARDQLACIRTVVKNLVVQKIQISDSVVCAFLSESELL